MNPSTKIFGVFAAAGLLSLSAACGGSSPAAPKAGACLEAAKQRGYLRVGTTSNLPIDAVDTSNGKLIGIIPDVLNAFIDDTNLGDKIRPEAMPFSSLIPAINSNKIDITSDTMFRTPEREKQINFTTTVLFNPEGLVVKKGNPKSLDALMSFDDNDSIATYQGTVWVDWLNELKADQDVRGQVFPGANELVQAVGSGQTDAGLMSSAIAAYMIKQNPQLGVQLASGYKPRSREGVATHLGLSKRCTDLKDAFDKWYQGYVSDGRMATTLAKWGVQPADTYLNGVAGYALSK